MPGPAPERTDASPERGTGSDAAATAPNGFVCLRDASDDGTIRFALSGELDIATAAELDQALRAAQQNSGLLTVDLRRLSFMDCRGLAVIVAAAERAGASGGSFRIVRGPPHVHRLFTVTEAGRLVAIMPAG